jgi:hypothetical protein
MYENKKKEKCFQARIYREEDDTSSRELLREDACWK